MTRINADGRFSSRAGARAALLALGSDHHRRKEETSDGYQALYHRRQAPAGEVRVVNAEGGNQEVRVDLDGNGEADMEILVTVANTLRAGDFILLSEAEFRFSDLTLGRRRIGLRASLPPTALRKLQG